MQISAMEPLQEPATGVRAVSSAAGGLRRWARLAVLLALFGPSLAGAAPGDAGRAASCPMSVMVGDQLQSLAEPIAHYGSAAAALSALKTSVDDLQRQYNDVCSRGGGLNTKAECAQMQRHIADSRGVVDAVACHARAEAAPAAGNGAKPSGGSRSGAAAGGGTGSGASGEGAGRGAAANAGAEGFLGFGASGSTGTAGRAGGFLGFEDSGKGGGDAGNGGSGSGGGAKAVPAQVGHDSFPTPRCEFLSDVSERHDPSALVCVGRQVYECVGRSAARGTDAWSRKTGGGGCGGVRPIEAVEQDARRLKAMAREKWLAD